eukprot:5090241-Pleurochrysis_carterae.AAC.1
MEQPPVVLLTYSQCAFSFPTSSSWSNRIRTVLFCEARLRARHRAPAVCAVRAGRAGRALREEVRAAPPKY